MSSVSAGTPGTPTPVYGGGALSNNINNDMAHNSGRKVHLYGSEGIFAPSHSPLAGHHGNGWYDWFFGDHNKNQEGQANENVATSSASAAGSATTGTLNKSGKSDSLMSKITRRVVETLIGF